MPRAASVGKSRARRKEEERAEAFFPLFDCSLPLADRARKPPPLSSLADERRVGSLLRSTAARDPVRATTTAADSDRDARAARIHSLEIQGEISAGR
jgi:hypothetical protein